MKKTAKVALFVLMIFAISACDSSDTSGDTAGGGDTDQAPVNGITVENAFMARHVDGHRTEREFPAFVLFEYEQLETVKYQVAFIACTCRGPEVNYWSVAYVEINKADNTVVHYSLDGDRGNHYTAGLYGDSVVSWDGARVQELLYEEFIPTYIMGASREEIDAYEPMHGEVDLYTGATVTPNSNMLMLQGLMEYHVENYG